MAEIELKSARFRQEREADWLRLDRLLRRVEQQSAASLSYDEMVDLPRLYRSALSSLSVARAISLDQNLIDYLEGLCARAYFFVYGTRSTLLERVAGFFARAWPRAVQGLWRETLAALAISIAGVLAGYLLTWQDPDWFSSFVPAGLAGERGPSASTEALRAVLYDSPEGGSGEGLSVFATFLFTHNAQVALFAFALGFAFCAPTMLLMAYNGCMLGAIFALHVQRGLGFELGGWLMIHGVTELFAIVLAGAAGFRIGWPLAFPGSRSRVDALAVAGREAATVMAGVVVMLFVAGVLEGFGRQLIKDDLVRYAIAGASLLVWLAYFYLPRRREPDLGQR